MMEAKDGLGEHPAIIKTTMLRVTTSTGLKFNIREGRDGWLKFNSDDSIVIEPRAANAFHFKKSRS